MVSFHSTGLSCGYISSTYCEHTGDTSVGFQHTPTEFHNSGVKGSFLCLIMAGPPQKWHKHARGQERRKSSPLKTIALGDGSYFPDTSHIEYVEGTVPPEVETLPPRRPPKAAIRDLHLFSGGHGSSSLASHPYARLCAGTDRAGPGAPGAPPTTPAGHGLPTIVNPLNGNQQIFLIPPAVSIVTQGDWPIIYFGDDAPFPRVRFTLNPKDPQYEKDLSMDLIKRAPGKWVIPGAIPTGDVRLDPTHPRYNAGYKVPRAFDSTIGLGGLQWTMDAGDNPASWNGLTRDQLLEFMYRSLEEILGDWVARDQLRKEISKGPLAKNVENVEDPLPSLPPPPKKGSFPHGQYGKHPLADAQTRFKNVHNFWGDYSRPSLAVQPGAKKDPKTLKLLPQRLFAHMREAMEKPDYIGDLHDISSEDDNAPPPGPGGGPGGGTGGGPGRPPRRSPRRSPNGALKEASKGSDLMKIDPPPVDPKLGPDPVDIIEDGGRTARVGEYKCVWFCVIILVLCMFLCLFLYSFKIIR